MSRILLRLVSCLCLTALLCSATIARAVLADSPESARPLAVGAHAPAPQLTGLDGKPFDLARAFAEKPTVLIFFRGGWCPFCNRHLAALAEHELELRALGYQIIAITPEPSAKLASTAEKDHVRYRLLSDEGFQAGPAYGVAYRIPAENAKGYHENGITLTRVPGSEDCWLPVPSAFIVSRDGVIRFVHADPDPSVRISPEDLLAAAKAAAAK